MFTNTSAQNDDDDEDDDDVDDDGQDNYQLGMGCLSMLMNGCL